MRRLLGGPTRFGAAAVVLFVSACGPQPSSSQSPSIVGDLAADARFRLALVLPKAEYAVDEVIEPVANLTFLGPEASIEIYHGAPPMPWKIEEVDGARRMEGIVETICTHTTVRVGQALAAPFKKTGQIAGPGEPGFPIAWFQEKSLRLPQGRWRISVTSEIALGDCGGEDHRLTAAIEITVR